MRIVIDIQGCQSEGSRIRGIGRYSLSFVKSLIRNFSEHEYILFANSSLYDSRMDFSEELQNRSLNVNYFTLHFPVLSKHTFPFSLKAWLGRAYALQ